MNGCPFSVRRSMLQETLAKRILTRPQELQKRPRPMTEFAGLAHLFRFQHNMLALATEGYTERHWRFQPELGGNPAYWLLGHITVYRLRIRQLLGETVDLPEAWREQFDRGTSPSQETAMVPAPEVLQESFRASGEALGNLLCTLTQEQAQADLGKKLPDGSTTLGGAAHFLYLHESLHLGHLQYLRRIQGLAGIR